MLEYRKVSIHAQIYIIINHTNVHGINPKSDCRTHGRGYLMRVRLPILLIVLEYVNSPSTARIRFAMRRVGRCGVFEGLEQVLREGEYCVISVSKSVTKPQWRTLVVLRDPCRIHALRQHDRSPLHVPADQHLCGGNLQLIRDVSHDGESERLLHGAATAERRIGFKEDPLLL